MEIVDRADISGECGHVGRSQCSVPHFIQILRERDMDTDGGWGGAQLITDRRTGVIIAAFRDGQELWRVIPGYREDGLSEGDGGW